MAGLPKDEAFKDSKMQEQFFYRYVDPVPDGADYLQYVAVRLHGSFILMTFYDSDEKATGVFRKTLVAPYDPVTS